MSQRVVKALSKQLDAGITAATALSSTCVPAMPLVARTEYLKVVSTTAGLVGLGSAVARHASAMLQLMASGEEPVLDFCFLSVCDCSVSRCKTRASMKIAEPDWKVCYFMQQETFRRLLSSPVAGVGTQGYIHASIFISHNSKIHYSQQPALSIPCVIMFESM